MDAPAGDEHYAHAPPLPSLLVRAFTGYQDGWWHAIALDYTIIGRGTSRDAAVENMIELLGDYLELCLRDGVTPTGAERPLPIKWRLELRWRVLVGVVFRLIHRSTARPRDLDIFLPRGAGHVC